MGYDYDWYDCLWYSCDSLKKILMKQFCKLMLIYTAIYSSFRRHELEYLDDGKFQTFFFGTVGGCKKKITSSHAVGRFDEK